MARTAAFAAMADFISRLAPGAAETIARRRVTTGEATTTESGEAGGGITRPDAATPAALTATLLSRRVQSSAGRPAIAATAIGPVPIAVTARAV